MCRDKLQKKILEYYSDGGKHSQYQNFPKFVSEEFGIVATIDESWRGDTARYNYISSYLEKIQYISLADIGANTGKFCLDLAYINPDKKFAAYEINFSYIEFINCIKEYFDIKNIHALNMAADKSGLDKIEKYDVILHMNVLHHSGIDFDSELVKDISKYREYAVEYLTKLNSKCKVLVFQMGYNWGGNKQTPIINVNNVCSMIEFEKSLFVDSGWNIEELALYDHNRKEYVRIDINCNYEEVASKIEINKNSEFYKRPLFILKSN